MSIESIVILLAIGAIAGWLAGVIMNGTGFGLIGDIVIGIVGAFVGGYLLGLLGVSIGAGIIGTIITSTIGAIVLLLIIRTVKKMV